MLSIQEYSTEMIAVCIIISIVAAFAYIYRNRVKDEYNALAGKPLSVKKEKPKKHINPQGSKTDYMQTLSCVVTLARKKHWQLFAPAVVEIGGAYIQLLALIVTPQSVIGICAFGHGGTLLAASGTQDWTQCVNDTENKVNSPIKTMNTANEVLRKVLKKREITGVDLEILGVFTHPRAVLQGAAGETCYTAETLLAHLRQKPDAPEKTDPEMTEMVEKLRASVIKPEKDKK